MWYGTFRTLGYTIRRPYATCATKAERFVKTIDPSTLPRGYLVSSTYAGIKDAIRPVTSTNEPSAATTNVAHPQEAPKPDVALIVSSVPAAIAGTFTTNVFKAAPVVHATTALKAAGPNARVRAILTNSGCANAVTGQQGLEDTQTLVNRVQALLSPRNQNAIPTYEQDARSSSTDVLMMSTGVIGVRLPVAHIQRCLEHLAAPSILQSHPDAWLEAARAYMTTDTFPKIRTRQFILGNRRCSIVGIDKGAGMIHPRMTRSGGQLHATLLGVFATDAPISSATLQRCLDEAVRVSFNCISVDGDMSTNDTILALANGQAPFVDLDCTDTPNEWTETEHPDMVNKFAEELKSLCIEMSHLIVRDGEGAEKFVQVHVRNAGTYEQAHAIASSISTSALVKCAMHGEDANWGRILCSAGYASLPASTPAWTLDPSKVNVTFLPPPHQPDDLASLPTLVNGVPQAVNETQAKKLLSYEDIYVDVDLQGGSWGSQGRSEATYWTCDFSKEYITVRW